jgi:DNA polymerase I-like protein with 3'-5' exonuclease and polymerase domains
MIPINGKLITNTADLLAIKDELMAAELLALDTESDGVGRFANVIGVSMATSPDTGYYIPITLYKPDSGLFRPWTDSAYQVLVSTLIDVFTKSKRLLLHNCTFDAKVIQNTFGIDILPYILADTALIYHTAINEEGPFGLKKLAVLHLDPDADSPQDDLKQSVIANGGSWTKKQKDFYRGDWKLLGHYAIYDVIYTRRLYDMFWPAIAKDPKLIKLWNEEVYPLIEVTYQLNTTGVRINVPYFEKLKLDMLDKISNLESEIFALIDDKLTEYSRDKIRKGVNITPRSDFGKFLALNNLWPWKDNSEIHNKAMMHWYKDKHGTNRIFNLDSGDDKAYLLFDILKLPSNKTTNSGKRSTSKDVLDELAAQYEDSSIVLKLLRERSKEKKLLSTYVEPILQTHINSRIYPSFNQVGTTSGRYSCGGDSINLQTLPREDTRIKAGFIPDDGNAFVAIDYSSLEPHIFSNESGETVLIDTMNNNLDFYSSIAVNVLGLKNVSANPKDENYLGKVDKEKRQWIKGIALSIPYGASAGRLSQMMRIDYDEAQEVYDKYLKAFPVLKKWMDRSELDMKKYGYVESIVGRRKRNATIHKLYSKYGVRNFSKMTCFQIMDKLGEIDGIQDGKSLYLECRNALNVAKNHKIQSLAASVCNQAMIDFSIKNKELGLGASIMLNVHDEIILQVPAAGAQKASEVLAQCMIDNKVANMLRVKLKATPAITTQSLAQAK